MLAQGSGVSSMSHVNQHELPLPESTTLMPQRSRACRLTAGIVEGSDAKGIAWCVSRRVGVETEAGRGARERLAPTRGIDYEGGKADHHEVARGSARTPSAKSPLGHFFDSALLYVDSAAFRCRNNGGDSVAALFM